MNIMGKAGFAAVLLAASSIAAAQWYAGGSVGRSTTSFNTSDFSTAGASESQDRNKAGNKVFAGYDLSRYWALEGGHAELGTPRYTSSASGPPFGNVSGTSDVKQSAWFLAAKGTLPVANQFNVFGKLGWTNNKLEQHNTSDNAAFNAAFGLPVDKSRRRSDMMFGFGGEYLVHKNVGIRFEYDDFGKFGDSNETGATKAGLWSVGATLKF